MLSFVSSGQECEFHSKNKKLLKVFKHEVGIGEVIVARRVHFASQVDTMQY